jgi:hypothetical protein
MHWDDKEAKDMFTHRDVADDSTNLWWWNGQGKPRELLYKYHDNFPSRMFAGVSIKLDMFKSPNELIGGWEKIGFLTFAILLTLGILKLLSFTYRKITLMEYFNTQTTEQIRTADANYIANLLADNVVSGKDFTNLIVISLPVTNVEKAILPPGKFTDDALPDDLKALNKVTLKQYKSIADNSFKVIMVPFFELSSCDSMKESLDTLATILKQQERKVIWIASSDPCEQVAALGKKVIASAADIDVQKMKIERENLLRILDEFKKINYRLEDNTDAANMPVFTNVHVEEEFRFGEYFKKLKINLDNSKTFDGYYKRTDNDLTNIDKMSDDLFVLKIQDMAQYYYYSIWITLSNKEKYVLYDLAQDELTNYRNYGTLVELERKGILYFDSGENCLKIFNKSFRNFILTVVDPAEAMLLERETNTVGTWDVIRTVMIVFVIGVGTFLFLTEKWFYNQLLVVFGAIAVIAPAVINFFDTGLKQLWTRKNGDK